MNLRPRIYIAGAIRNPNNIQFLDNLRQGMRIATELIIEGYAPFCPFLDFMYFFQLREGEFLTVNDIHEYSLSFLPGSRAVLVLSTLGRGEGVILELDKACELNIPIFYHKEVLLMYLKDWRPNELRSTPNLGNP